MSRRASGACASHRMSTTTKLTSIVRHRPDGRADMTVTIARVDTIALRIPYDHWAPKPAFGGIARETMDCLLVRVTASNGLVGWGEAFWGGWQATQAAIEHWIAPLSLG